MPNAHSQLFADRDTGQHFVNWQQDPHGNWLARFVFPEKSTELSITVDLIAEMEVINPFDFFIEPYAEKWPFSFPPRVARGSCGLSTPEPAGPLLAELSARSPRAERNTIDFLVDLNRRLQRKIRYLIRMEPGVQTPEETSSSGAGSCRDSAWLLVQLLRHLGLPARFVSGYLIQFKADLKPLEGPPGTDSGFHRSACLDRGLLAGRRLDRARPHLGPALRRRSSAGRSDTALSLGGADQRPGRAE